MKDKLQISQRYERMWYEYQGRQFKCEIFGTGADSAIEIDEVHLAEPIGHKRRYSHGWASGRIHMVKIATRRWIDDEKVGHD